MVIINRAGVLCYINDINLLSNIKSADDLKEINECGLIKLTNSINLIDQKESVNTSIDALLPILHGPNGEDGTIQGMCEFLGLPYVGCNIASSAMSIDKDLMKKILLNANIPTLDYVCISKNMSEISYTAISSSLKSEILFIKPAIMGSSIGVSKVKNEAEFNDALDEAFKYGDKIVIEPAVIARELECAVLQKDGQIKASVIGEIIPQHDFYSYEAKYIDDNGAKLSIPADISNSAAEKIKELAKKVFLAMECRDLSRIDFFMTDSNEIYVNELNTMPGFTSISMYPKLLEYDGISYKDIVDTLIQSALNR